jgi:nucleolar protein 56
MSINKSELLKEVKKGIKKELTSPDQRIISLSLLSEKIPSNINELFEALRIITDTEYPSLDSVLSIKEYCQVYNLDEVNEKTLEKIGLDKKRIKLIINIVNSDIGIKFSEKEKELTKSLSSNILTLLDIKDRLNKDIEQLLIESYPTFTKVASPIIATKMLIIAGGIKRLSSFPASTIQLLGSEKSFFKALAQKKNTPKYGVLFNHPLIISLPLKQKGKIARTIGSKIVISIKSDLAGKDISKELLDKINFKIKNTK